MKIGIIVDNPYRDLPGMVLVARELALSGAQCYLIPFNLRDSEIWPIIPDFLLLNFLRLPNEGWVRKMSQTGIRFGVLETESVVWGLVPNWALEDLATAEHIVDKKKNFIYNYFITTARATEVRAAADCFFAWSKTTRDFLLRAQLYSSEQIIPTGSPRTDMLSPRYQEATRQLSRYADEHKKPIILINASFPIPNPAFTTSEQEIELMIKSYKYTRRFCEQFQQAQADGLRGVASLANELAKSFPNATFILRPHPFEGTSLYRFLLDDLQNLKLIKQGTVDGWLLRASALIQLSSSTAVEAAILGVPVFLPTWLPSCLHTPTSDEASVAVQNVEEMKRYISQVLEGHYQPSKEKGQQIAGAIDHTYSTVDGFAHKRVAQAILETVRKPAAKPSINRFQCRIYSSRVLGTRLKKIVKTALNVLTRRSVHWSWLSFKNDFKRKLPWDQTEKRFEACHVQEILDALSAADSSAAGQVHARQAERSDYHFGYREGRSVIVAIKS